MRFYEFEAKQLLRRRGVPLPGSRLAHTADEAADAQRALGGPVVLKSQVLSGGRMKAGGVRFADTAEEARSAAEAILALSINDQRPTGVLVEQKGEIAQEYYAAVTWDGRAKRPVIIFSDMGGIDIEEVAETAPRAPLAHPLLDPAGRSPTTQAKVAVARCRGDRQPAQPASTRIMLQRCAQTLPRA